MYIYHKLKIKGMINLNKKCYIITILFSITLLTINPYNFSSNMNLKPNKRLIIYVAGDESHPPYEYIDEKGNYKGFSVDIMNAIALEKGFDVEFVPMKWDSTIKALENKEVDVIQGMSKTKEREERFLFSDSIAANSQVIFVADDTNCIAGIDDLSGLKVSVQQGDVNYEILENIPDIVLLEKSTQQEALISLLKGESDAFVGNKLTGFYYLQKMKESGKAKIVGEPLVTTEYSLVTNKGNEQLARMLNDGIKIIKKKGTYEKIYSKWFGEEILDKKGLIKSYSKEIAIISIIILVFFANLTMWNNKLKKEVANRTKELQKTNKDLLIKQQEIHNLAYYDTITSLPNRLFFIEELDKTINEYERDNKIFAVLNLDIDRFKHINDTLGHNIGDIILKFVGIRLNYLVNKEDMLARISGNDFYLLMKDLKDEEDAINMANNILDEFKKPFNTSEYELFLTGSIGICFYPDGGENSNYLMKNSDMAMHRAKENGGNTYCVYNKEMNEKQLENLILINGLRCAGENDELFLYYQPKIDLLSKEVIGMEALIRWMNPTIGFLRPDKFIPIAEEVGLIIPIGEWVLKRACFQNKLWIDKGYKPRRVSVNISTRQFRYPNFVQMVEKIIDETNMTPEYLEFEITESVVMEDIEDALEKLKRLKNLGLYISIDDFGTGYSSLRYLKEMSVDELKIDRSFISDLDMNNKNKAIVKSIINLAHELNLEIIAEGVENEEQIQFLKENGCDKVQGFYYSEPIPPQEFERIFMD